jgi:hypothetical protein
VLLLDSLQRRSTAQGPLQSAEWPTCFPPRASPGPAFEAPGRCRWQNLPFGRAGGVAGPGMGTRTDHDAGRYLSLLLASSGGCGGCGGSDAAALRPSGAAIVSNKSGSGGGRGEAIRNIFYSDRQLPPGHDPGADSGGAPNGRQRGSRPLDILVECRCHLRPQQDEPPRRDGHHDCALRAR